MRPSKIVAQFECSKNQVPSPLFRVRYSGNQSLKARSKPTFKSASDFKTAVELHLQWCSCEPTPFVSVFADKEHATKWAQRLLEHGYHDVVLLELDSSKLGALFNVRELVVRQEIETSLAEYLYEDEFLVLREIPKASIISTLPVNCCQTGVDYESSDSSEEEIDTRLSRYLKALDLEYERRP
ncbi:hypothetical protein V7S43_012992 [Phytophthora oleae]|uniref:DUF7587 domain-containing protein n=1 Tax=Phytophthora oleae TaxID=2107226 RepID=A0ABD3F5R9_9STRA